jgi:hypothetical protein
LPRIWAYLVEAKGPELLSVGVSSRSAIGRSQTAKEQIEIIGMTLSHERMTSMVHGHWPNCFRRPQGNICRYRRRQQRKREKLILYIKAVTLGVQQQWPRPLFFV